MIIIPQIVADRYREACESPDLMRWRSLAYLASFMAETIVKHEPDSVMADDLKTIAELAWQHSIDLEPVRDEEQFNTLAGVALGWFGWFRSAA